MLRDKLKTFGASIALHVVIGGILAALATTRVIEHLPEIIEIEIVPAPPPAKALEVPPPPEPPPPEPEPPTPPEVPRERRPERMPETAKMVKVEEPKPFQEDALDESGEREAPPDTEAVPAPTIPLPVVDMATTVGTGTSEYVTTSSGVGSVPVLAGRGGGRGGAGIGRGAPGPLANQGAVGVAVSRDWQVTAMPEPLNDNDFEPEYPPLARREGREAVVVLRLVIDADGVVRRVLVLEAPESGGFAASARRYAQKLRFRPARAGTRPVAARIDWTVHYYVRN
ncbi:energy transducer TonB [Haliangium sp.]|uniref:energy transducer TonB n=1 Tax=Haliangium sp. TaxID=2663208 RepID=UPI003D106412